MDPFHVILIWTSQTSQVLVLPLVSHNYCPLPPAPPKLKSLVTPLFVLIPFWTTAAAKMHYSLTTRENLTPFTKLFIFDIRTSLCPGDHVGALVPELGLWSHLSTSDVQETIRHRFGTKCLFLGITPGIPDPLPRQPLVLLFTCRPNFKLLTLMFLPFSESSIW